MSSEDLEQIEFRNESLELLENAEKCLLALESGGDFKENFDAIFRVFHNLKGASGMMGKVELGQLMHQLENRLNSIRENQKLTKGELDYFLKGVDEAKTLFENSQPAAPAGLAEFLAEAQEISQRISAQAEQAHKGTVDATFIDSVYRDVHTLKGGAYLFHLKDLGDLNHAVESVLDAIRSGETELSPAVTEALVEAADLIELSIGSLQGHPTEDLSARIHNAKILFRVNTKDEETPTAVSTPSAAPAPVPAPAAAALAVVSPAAVPSATGDPDKDAGGTIRVSVTLLDKLMTLMGEMVLVRNQVIQYSSRTDDLEFLNLSQRLNVITGEIQSEMMRTRMQPIGNVLTKFSRLVRDLSKDLGKKIELHLSGSDTELDKTLLEAIKDPLTHIVRNSCDHGIETCEERRATGKSETGNIFVTAFHEGGQVIVEIKDDGKGLHRDKLLKKAIEKEILTPERAQTLSDREIIQLIFAPGFSTAAKVTNVSGRGVGMDVVRTNIERIGGAVEIHSEAGTGTTLRLKIPLTLAIVPAMIVKCESDSFAIPQLKLVELLRVDPESSEHQIEYLQGQPVYRLRGHVLPLIHIRNVLGLPQTSAELGIANIVVLRSEQFCFGLIVDDIQDTADIVVKPLARFLKPISIFSGATVLGDGAIALILDVAGIVKDCILKGDRQIAASSNIQAVAAVQKREDAQDFLLFKVSTEATHAVLLNYVHRLEEIPRSSVEISDHRRVVRYRNSVLPLVSVDHALGLSGATDADVLSVVVIEKAGLMYGLVVKDILDVLNTEAELDTVVRSQNGVIGNLVTEAGIIVVVDPYIFIQNEMGVASLAVRGNTSMVAMHPVRRILYAEDAAFFRRHVSKTLTAAGFEVTLANDGRAAFEVMEKSADGAFDLILSDIEMPIMNGFEFAAAIRRNQRWANLPMIALSSRADKKYVERGLKEGFHAYLEKMNAEELLRSIAALSEKGAA